MIKRQRSNISGLLPSMAKRTKALKILKESQECLESFGISVCPQVTRAEMFISVTGFMKLVDLVYHQCSLSVPSISKMFTSNMFKYICALVLTARVEAVRFRVLGYSPPTEVRAPVPDNIEVLQVISFVLSVIGITEIDEIRTLFLPNTALPNAKYSKFWNDDFENRLAQGVAFD